LHTTRAKICGESFGSFGHEKSEIALRNREECEFKIFPDQNGKIRFHSVKLQDTFQNQDYLQPDCDIMQIYVRDQNSLFGPYCNQKRRSRTKRSALENWGIHSMEELENATFEGNEIDLVFVKDQNAYRQRLLFNYFIYLIIIIINK